MVAAPLILLIVYINVDFTKMTANIDFYRVGIRQFEGLFTTCPGRKLYNFFGGCKPHSKDTKTLRIALRYVSKSWDNFLRLLEADASLQTKHNLSTFFYFFIFRFYSSFFSFCRTLLTTGGSGRSITFHFFIFRCRTNYRSGGISS